MARIESLKISISGVRGIVGETLTPRLLTAFAGAFATYVGRGPVLVGRDTRQSGDMVRRAVFAGLLSAGCEPVDLGICPVPSIQIRTLSAGARGAIAITASHNPVEWNALKFIGSQGLFLNTHQAEELLDIYHQRSFVQVPAHEIPRAREDPGAIDEHIERLLRFFDAATVRRHEIRVVVDSCNGAGSIAAPRFLRELGCDVIELHTTPDGLFPRDPEPIPENLQALTQWVKRHRADVGFAQDADADRLAIVDGEGRPIGEDYTLALAAMFVLEKRPGPIVSNLSTSRAIDDVANRLHCPVIRTRIGEINVVEAMIENDAVIGGEGNGGVILPEIHLCRDSMGGMGAVLQLMAERATSLQSIVSQIPRYHMVKKKVRCPLDRVPRVLESLRTTFAPDRVNSLDGLKLEWQDAWLHVRASNTEPVVRVVAESKSLRHAQTLVRDALRLIQEIQSVKAGKGRGSRIRDQSAI